MQPNNDPFQPARTTASPQQQDAAVAIARQQVEQALGTPQLVTTAATPQSTSPYQRTHQPTHTISEADWSIYHSAWQSYYQQYYERYYAHQRRAGGSKADDAPVSQDAALSEIRQRLRDNVVSRAQSVRASRHFGPIVAAVIVMFVFGFLQYNQLIFGTVYAYVQPGSVDPQNIIVDPSLSTDVDPSSRRVIIPKINVDAPVDFNAKPDYQSQIASMRHGLAYFGIPGANSKPGQVGVTAIAGHSSSDAFSSSTYKFVFSQIHKLVKGDTIYVTYKGTRYTYVVIDKKEVLPTNVQALAQPTTKPLLTLITCSPVGTAEKRLFVTAEQVNPSPTKASRTPTSSQTEKVDEIAGTEPTLLGRLFGQ